MKSKCTLYARSCHIWSVIKCTSRTYDVEHLDGTQQGHSMSCGVKQVKWGDKYNEISRQMEYQFANLVDFCATVKHQGNQKNLPFALLRQMREWKRENYTIMIPINPGTIFWTMWQYLAYLFTSRSNRMRSAEANI